ncbi:hypothetical protein B5D80_05915 [Micromonospora wenchangensis]|uniref:Gram-positive cocci surface proteins LPxTG domain-containing protein n=1 Tax=Micromonospora wenchangensis TaxID=1185415 RepID=A0A246RS03_9ACTN|nr:hypothetical protein [Micromonospora wenchangensis]OWV10867.1 hypothetical protein B5D80_05915 [Micromonospora wenchangensis]
MANKMLGKVVAGAALGGASLLVFTPGIAFADGHHDGESRDGKVIAKPHVVKPGDEVKLIEICPEAQEHAFVWSKVTGKVKLKPAEGRGEEHGGWKDDEGKGEDHGKGEEGKGEDHGKGPDGQAPDDHGPKPQPPAEGGQPPADGGQPPAGGQGGGFMAADQGPDHGGKPEEGKGDEHGKPEEGKGEEHGKPGAGEESGEHGKPGWDEESDEGDWQGHEGYGQDDEYGYGKDEESGYGKDEGGWGHKKDFVYYGEAEVSEDARPGRYELNGSCGEGELVVLPKGHVDGGDGGMTTTGADRGMVAGGAGMIGAAALGGIVLMRRRRADELG